MEALERGDWCFVGIMAKAEVVTPSGTIQILRSGGLWGIESDSDESYLGEIRAEQLDELCDELDAFGFGKRAIDCAIQRAEHRPLGGDSLPKTAKQKVVSAPHASGGQGGIPQTEIVPRSTSIRMKTDMEAQSQFYRSLTYQHTGATQGVPNHLPGAQHGPE